MKISFILSCPLINGNGHISRVSSIAKYYEKKNYKTYLYIVSKEIKKKSINNKYFKKINIFQNYFDLKKNFLDCNILIIDDYSFPSKFIKLFKIMSDKTFYIHDHKKIKLIKPIKRKLTYRNNKYHFINFFINPLIVKKKPNFNNKVLITFGTGKIENKLLIFLKYLQKIDKLISKKYYLDITNQFNSSHIKLVNTFKNFKIKNITNVYYFKNINNYIFSVNAAGVTSMEMLYLQIPQVVFLFSRNQIDNFNYLKNMNLEDIKLVGRLNNKNFYKFQKYFLLMLNKINIQNYKMSSKNDIVFSEELPLI